MLTQTHTFFLSLSLSHVVVDKDEAASRRRSPPLAAAGSALPARLGSDWRRGGSTRKSLLTVDARNGVRGPAGWLELHATVKRKKEKLFGGSMVQIFIFIAANVWWTSHTKNRIK